MRIALDAMGGDHAPGPIVVGAIQAVAGKQIHLKLSLEDLAGQAWYQAPGVLHLA